MESDTPKSLAAVEPPYETELLLWVQARVDGQMLHEISTNDRGDDFSEHLAALKEQLRLRPPLGALPWHPLEVLDLETHSKLVPSDQRGHLKRLLACTILLRNAGHTENPRDSNDDILDGAEKRLLQLTLSSLALDVPKRALGFVLWMLEAPLRPEIRPFAAFCALLLATAAGFGKASEAEILEVCGWVHREERHCREFLNHGIYSDRWLVGLSVHERRPEDRARWCALAKQVFGRLPREYSERVQAEFRGFTMRLEEKSRFNPRDTFR